MNAQDIRLPVEGGLVYCFGGKGELVADVEQVIIDDAHPEAAGGDAANTPPDPAHAQQAKRQFVELPAANCIADPLEFFGLVSAIFEECPWTEHLKDVSEDKIANGKRVGVRGVDDLYASGAAGGDIDVLEAHASPAHHAKARSPAEKRLIDKRISPHNQAFSGRKMRFEVRVAGSGFNDPCAFPEPLQRTRIRSLSHQDQWQMRCSHECHPEASRRA